MIFNLKINNKKNIHNNNGDKMKKGVGLIILILSIVLVGLYMVTSTYAVIVEVIEKDGILEIINDVTVKDILTNDDGSFNSTYYMVKDELKLNDEESNQLLNSVYLDEALQKVLKSIAEYKIKGNQAAKLTDDELYQLIAEAVLKTNGIDDEIKSRIINKASYYKKDVSKYIYDIEVSLFGENI